LYWCGYHLGGIDAEPKKAVPRLVAVLKNPHGRIRAVAAEALGRIGKGADSAESALEDALNDKDAHVRRAAAVALEHIGGKPTVRSLIHALKDEDTLVSVRASLALGRMGAEAVPHLPQALKDPHPT